MDEQPISSFDYLNRKKEPPKEPPKEQPKEPKPKPKKKTTPKTTPKTTQNDTPKTTQKKTNDNGKKKTVEKVKEPMVIKTIEELGLEVLSLKKDIRNLFIITCIVLFFTVVISITGYNAFVKLGWLKI